MIDEGCWQRAQDNLTGLSLESFASVNLTAGPAIDNPDTAARMADLLSLRLLATKAFASNAGDGVKAPAFVRPD